MELEYKLNIPLLSSIKPKPEKKLARLAARAIIYDSPVLYTATNCHSCDGCDSCDTCDYGGDGGD